MRVVLGAFVLGVIMLQQRAALPGALAWWIGALVWCAAIALVAITSVRSARHGRVAALRSTSYASCTLRIVRLGGLALAAFLVGYGYAAWRGELRLREALPLAWEGREVELEGAIRGLPVRERSSARFLFAVDADHVLRETGIAGFPSIVQLNWIDRRGGGVPELVPGQRWRLAVRLKRPHGNANFGARDTEASLIARGARAAGYVASPARARRLPGTEGGIGSMIDRARLALAKRIDQALGGAAHRGIVLALAIGAQEAVSASDRLALQRTGTSHLVAISGLHIGFVAGIGAALAGWLWRRSCLMGAVLARRGMREWPLIAPTPFVAVLAGTLCAAGYAALAGFNVPAQRALWMLIVVSVAFALGRSLAPLLVLAWAAALVLVVDPWAVVSAGFWLSFGAVAVISFAMHARLRKRKKPDQEAGQEADEPWGPDADPPNAAANAKATRRRTWRQALGARLDSTRETVMAASRAQYAVALGLAPLTAFWFSQISLAGPLANALAVPWVSFAVTPVVLVGIALPAPLDTVAFELAHALLAPLMRWLQRLSDQPWAEWRLARPSAWAMVSAGLGVFWCLTPRGWPLRFAAPLAWLPLALPPPVGPPAGTFRLTALDVGQGSAILVETARHALLFDAGPGPESTHAGERIVGPYLHANGVPVLDTLVVSHADADHAGGAPAVLDAARVRQLLGSLPASNPLWANAQAREAETLRCAAGQRWRWDGVEFAVLWPDPGPLPAQSTNAQSCVLKVTASGLSALLTGDIDASIEHTLRLRAPDALQADVLVVAHHGSKTSSTEPFLDSVNPRAAVFQVGYRNRFGHPHAGVWARFAARGIELARTDRDGAVRVELEAGVPILERYRDTHRRYWMDRWPRE